MTRAAVPMLFAMIQIFQETATSVSQGAVRAAFPLKSTAIRSGDVSQRFPIVRPTAEFRAIEFDGKRSRDLERTSERAKRKRVLEQRKTFSLGNVAEDRDGLAAYTFHCEMQPVAFASITPGDRGHRSKDPLSRHPEPYTGTAASFAFP